MKFEYSEEKNQQLVESRGKGFEDIIQALSEGKLIANLPHFQKQKYPNQFLLLVEIEEYIYVVPYIKNLENNTYFLKTIYPSCKFTKLYLKNEKK